MTSPVGGRDIAVGGRKPMHIRLRWIAALPQLAGLVVLAVAAVLFLTITPSFISGALVGGMVVAALLVVNRGMRLIRRACTTVERRLSRVKTFFKYGDASSRQKVAGDLDALADALRVRLFGLVPLVPEDQVDELIGALREAAQTSPPRLPEDLAQTLASVSAACWRWIDTLA